MFNQMMLYYGDILPFLEDNPDLSPATTMKLKSILSCSKKSSLLQVELASLIDAGEAFVKATYKLEGDGAVVFQCYVILAELHAGISTAYFPTLNSLCATLSCVLSKATELRKYGLQCVQPGLQYFQDKFSTDLQGNVEAFKAARLFVPKHAVELKPDADTIDCFTAFPFLTSEVIAKLKSELPSYLVKAADAPSDTPVLTWWKDNESKLPFWSSALKKIVLVQPTSAAAEMVFSLLNNSFGDKQADTLQDYLEASLMLQYNNR